MRLSCAVKRFCVTIRNSSDRALNRYENAHKTRKECVLAPACLATSHRDAILTSRKGQSEPLLFTPSIEAYVRKPQEQRFLLWIFV